jgi:hypothetical protein
VGGSVYFAPTWLHVAEQHPNVNCGGRRIRAAAHLDHRASRSGVFSCAMSYGYNESFVGGQPPVQVHRVGGWKLMLGGMVAAVGLGFAGFVYLGPYQKVTKAFHARAAELEQERQASQDLAAERDKLKAELSKREGTEHDHAQVEAKKQQAVDAFAAEMKTALGAFGANLTAGGGRAEVTFATTSVFDQPISTVISPQGDAAIKILAGALKKAGFRTRVMAKLISTPPPRELAQFKNVGEFTMLRAVRVALLLAAAGVAPERVAAAGETPVAGGHKGKATVPDRLEIEIEPE